MKNKIVIVVVCFFTLFAIGCSILYCYFPNKFLGEMSFAFEELALLSGLLMVVMNGRFITTIIGIIFIALCFTISIGNVLKIHHWLNGSLMIFLTFWGLFIVYSKWFFMKKPKTRLDIMKYIWVLTFFISNYYYRPLQLISQFEYHFILDAVFLIVFLEFIITGIKAKSLFKN